MSNYKTYSAKPSDVTRAWHVLDAATIPFGRLSTQAAILLMGKHKAQFTHHIDCGDNVIVINSDKLVATGKKMNQKMYHRHSGFPGGLTSISLEGQMEKDSCKVIERAIYGMLPVNRLRPERMRRLKVYAGEEHNHAAQKPVEFALKGAK
jgi:large subunit ribosomal protein L13